MSGEFPPSPASVTQARRFVAEVLTDAGLRGSLLDSAGLVASELAANAVLHARTPYEVRVEVGDQVRISVIDGSPAMPVLLQPDLNALGGRGLVLVDSVSASWGADPRPGGKCVWSVLDAQSGRWWSAPPSG